MTTNFFDTALEAVVRLDDTFDIGELGRDDLDLVIKALRESLRLNKGLRAENDGLRARLQAQQDASGPITPDKPSEALLAAARAVLEAEEDDRVRRQHQEPDEAEDEAAFAGTSADLAWGSNRTHPLADMSKGMTAIRDLHKRCSFPMRADAIAASDTCQHPATSGVSDSPSSPTMWRCDSHRGQVFRPLPDGGYEVTHGYEITHILHLRRDGSA
jgi:hypothetical protein